MADAQSPSPGWYDDGSGQLRWWDGEAWGELAPAEGAQNVAIAPSNGARRWWVVAALAGGFALFVIVVSTLAILLTRDGGTAADVARTHEVSPTGYRGIVIGDDRSDVLDQVDGLDASEISETGLSVVKVDDADVVLIDGEVTEIHSRTDRFVTPEGIKTGDDISAATTAYSGSDDEAPTVTASSITWAADLKAGTGYRFSYSATPDSTPDAPHGQITEVALVNHVPTFVSTPVMVVLDSSGSMEETDVYPTRWEAAVAAAGALVDTMPAGHQVGLTVYGQGECTDVDVALAMSPLDRDSFKNTLAAYYPSGVTPIAYSLQIAAEQVPPGQESAIVLVSDGLDNCDTPPCDVAAQLKSDNPQLTIHTIGFSVDGGAQAELDCIARAGGGVNVLADNQVLLTSRLSAMFNSQAAEASLQPDSYQGIHLGDRASQLKGRYEGAFDDVAGDGRVEVVYVDCVVVFEKGVVVEIRSRNAKMRTVDDLRVGDDVRRAQQLYDGIYEPRIEEHTATYVVDPIRRTGYQFEYAPAADSTVDAPSGRILRIVLCQCVDDLVPVDENSVRVTVTGTHGKGDPDPDNFVNMRLESQLDAQKTKANERAYEGASLDVTCYVEGFTYDSAYWERSSNRFARLANSDLFVATLFLTGDDGSPIDDDPSFPAC